MSSTTEPHSTPITGETIAPSQRLVTITLDGGPRFLDAYEIQEQDFNVITRRFQNNNTQRWWLTNVGDDVYTIVQLSSGRYLDAHEIPDYRAVTRPQQNDNTQRWHLEGFGGSWYTIQQVSSGRFLEADITASPFRVVTRPASGSNLQTWRIVDVN